MRTWTWPWTLGRGRENSLPVGLLCKPNASVSVVDEAASVRSVPTHRVNTCLTITRIEHQLHQLRLHVDKISTYHKASYCPTVHMELTSHASGHNCKGVTQRLQRSRPEICLYASVFGYQTQLFATIGSVTVRGSRTSLSYGVRVGSAPNPWENQSAKSRQRPVLSGLPSAPPKSCSCNLASISSPTDVSYIIRERSDQPHERFCFIISYWTPELTIF